jgi:hypothetical protein
MFSRIVPVLIRLKINKLFFRMFTIIRLTVPRLVFSSTSMNKETGECFLNQIPNTSTCIIMSIAASHVRDWDPVGEAICSDGVLVLESKFCFNIFCVDLCQLTKIDYLYLSQFYWCFNLIFAPWLLSALEQCIGLIFSMISMHNLPFYVVVIGIMSSWH